ncbi:hypothetical protein [Longispora albida]|uniref:hypothetical protein n=1 Tax=Longispora albida TaxID=203523 RepID=UPI000477F9CC|nr:hypothetical protein [Longispora albida]
MNTPAKLGAFVLGLAVVFGGAYGAGKLAGPVEATPPAAGHATAGHGTTQHDQKNPDPQSGPAGLAVSDQGYTLSPGPAAAGEFAFRILGPDGQPVTRYEVAHDKRMHLIVARRDLSGFRHVHPELDASGVWRVPSPFGTPGEYRAFADFRPSGGPALTLGVDVPVAGAFSPVPLPGPAASATVDGYTVSVDGTLEPGRTSQLTLTVTKAGAPVTDLQPYLGAYGHLVALRQGDLAYLHVHPDGVPGDGKTQPGPAIRFFAEVPSAGTYRIYLDFQHGGVVRTAEFTLVAGPAPAQPAPAPSPAASHGSDGHGHP